MSCKNCNAPNFTFAIKDGLDESFTPTRGDSRSTGWDVRAAEGVTLNPTQRVLIPLGIRCFAPEGYWLELRPRSSTFGKKSLHSLYGVIDESYEGELFFACQWIPDFHDGRYDDMDFSGSVMAYLNREFTIEKGERIGQIVPVKRQEMDVNVVSNSEFKALCEARGLERGAGGFGSTGK